MLLTGTFLRSVDDKQRIAIPKRLRDLLFNPPGRGVFITPGPTRSLAIYAEEVLKAYGERLLAASPAEKDVVAFRRMFSARTEPLEIDSQGRVRIPQPLVELAGLGKEAYLIGVVDHLELWDRTAWETYLLAHTDQYDELAVRAFDAATATGVPSTKNPVAT